MKRIFCDGSGNGNFAYVDEEGNFKVGHLDGITAVKAEYHAVILGMETEKDDLEVMTDSEIVVKQLNRIWRVRDMDIAELVKKCWKLMEGRTVTIKKCRGTKNPADVYTKQPVMEDE